ncbi:hypothetical protein [Methylocystis heyeri]|uniref:Uncharacterized protein n=1 Tax=Methylocystis heyeri TaxID=391905 RepID=A0A6B8KJE7_9HYPH|nr:hypothetical protein [Methylocystis heyeri]QGM46693.1 hypothetical protein H2LOC_013875 [Methylocystis heyeri]
MPQLGGVKESHAGGCGQNIDPAELALGRKQFMDDAPTQPLLQKPKDEDEAEEQDGSNRRHYTALGRLRA